MPERPATPDARPDGTEILWQASFGPSSILERIDAAAAAGFSAISASVLDGDTAGGSGPDPDTVVRKAADLGIGIPVQDGAMEWYPHDPPKRPLGGHPTDRVLRACDRLGVSSLSCLAPYPSRATVPDLAGCFAELCDRAGEHGLRVHLEFTPFEPVPDLATAWEIVRLAGRPNGGILLDTWHFAHGRPDMDLLAAIPGDRIMAVQVNDGRPGRYRDSLIKDTFLHRDLPGEGSFDLLGILRILHRTGGLNLVGPEVLSDEMFDLTPAELAVKLADTTRAVFTEAFPAGADPERQ